MVFYTWLRQVGKTLFKSIEHICVLSILSWVRCFGWTNYWTSSPRFITMIHFMYILQSDPHSKSMYNHMQLQIFLYCVLRTSKIDSQQVSNIPYSTINYNHHAVNYIPMTYIYQICISWPPSSFLHFFTYLLAICMSSLGKCLFRSSAYF